MQGKKVQLVQDRDPDAEAPNHLSPSEPPQALPLVCFTVTLTCNTHTHTRRLSLQSATHTTARCNVCVALLLFQCVPGYFRPLQRVPPLLGKVQKAYLCVFQTPH